MRLTPEECRWLIQLILQTQLVPQQATVAEQILEKLFALTGSGQGPRRLGEVLAQDS